MLFLKLYFFGRHPIKDAQLSLTKNAVQWNAEIRTTENRTMPKSEQNGLPS